MSKNLKGSVLAFALALTLGAPASSVAQAAAASPAGNKIAIVNIQQAIANTNEGKKETDALEQKFSTRQAALKAQNDEVEGLKKQLETQGAKLSDEERNNRIKVATDKQKAFQRNYEDFQNEVQQSEQEILSRLGKKMLDVMEKYAKENGYAMVLDVSNPQTPVLYASPATDITKELVEAYNTASPVAAPAAKPAASSTAPRPGTGNAARPPAGSATPKKP
ncbi:MAG TPA: OmpH family outer membrane protein [Candidatus Angelobacter sp.]|nr:OmpH family outer membrane protein [Candidatus Angelobacter sp.]